MYIVKINDRFVGKTKLNKQQRNAKRFSDPFEAERFTKALMIKRLRDYSALRYQIIEVVK